MDLGLVLESIMLLLRTLYNTVIGIIVAVLPASWLPQKNVAGQKVLITGAGSGLGRMMAVRFAELGSELILWDINTEGNEGTAEIVREKGADVHSYTVDLSDRNAIYATAEKVKTDVGDVDILINNAGIVTGKKFLQCPDGLIEKTMQVNTNALFWTTKSFLPAMLDKNSGHVVNIASSAGLFGVVGLADYCASKHGAVGFDESLRNEIMIQGKTGVKTTCVCPFYINTGMFEGTQTRFPTLLPIVEPEYAVQKIMEATLTNQIMLLFPRILYLFYALRGILPISVMGDFNVFFGATSGMDEFKGRAKRE